MSSRLRQGLTHVAYACHLFCGFGAIALCAGVFWNVPAIVVIGMIPLGLAIWVFGPLVLLLSVVLLPDLRLGALGLWMLVAIADVILIRPSTPYGWHGFLLFGYGLVAFGASLRHFAPEREPPRI